MFRAFAESWPNIAQISDSKTLPANKVIGLTNRPITKALPSPSEDVFSSLRSAVSATVNPVFGSDIGYLDTALMPYVRDIIDVLDQQGTYVDRKALASDLSADFAILVRDGPQKLAQSVVYPNDIPSWFEEHWVTPDEEIWTPWSKWFTWRLQGIASVSSNPFKFDASLAGLGRDFWDRPHGAILTDLTVIFASPEQPDRIDAPPAALPAQDTGARFEVRDNRLNLGLSSPAEQGQADYDRLKAFKPLVLDSLQEFLSATPIPFDQQSNDPYARVRRHARAYVDALDGAPLNQVDFGLLFGLGTMLQNRLAADTRPNAESDLAALSPRQRMSLEDFQTQHGLFITSSEVGLSALAAAERIERNPSEEMAIASAMRELADDIGSVVGIASPEVLLTVRDAADEIGQGNQAERASVYGVGTARNLAIVMFAGATVAAAHLVGGMVAGPMGTLVATYSTALIVVEATKRSAAFRDLSQPITDLMDLAKAGELLKAVRRNTDRLRTIAGNRPEMAWLRDYLDWLNDPSQSDDQP